MRPREHVRPRSATAPRRGEPPPAPAAHHRSHGPAAGAAATAACRRSTPRPRARTRPRLPRRPAPAPRDGRPRAAPRPARRRAWRARAEAGRRRRDHRGPRTRGHRPRTSASSSDVLDRDPTELDGFEPERRRRARARWRRCRARGSGAPLSMLCVAVGSPGADPQATRVGEAAALWRVCGCEPRSAPVSSARFAVRRVAPAPAAVLAQLQPLRIVPLALVGLIIPSLALFTRESCSDPNISTSHVGASVWMVRVRLPDRGRENERRPAPSLSVARPGR